MALTKLMKLLSGKPTAVASGDSIEQFNEARVYTPDAGLSLGGVPDHQWFLDETDTSTAFDTTTGTALNLSKSGTINSVAGVTAGTINAFDFVGGSATSSDVATSTLIPNGKFSVSFWMNPGSWTGTLRPFTHVNTYPDYTIILDVNSGSGNVSLNVRNAANTTDITASAAASLGSGWANWILTYDGDTGDAEIYRNNSLVGSGSGGASSGIKSTTAPIILGGGINASMDLVHFWSDYILSSGDRTALYAGGSPSVQNAQSVGPIDGDLVYLASGKVSAADASDSTKINVLGFYSSADDSVITKRGTPVTNFNVEASITLATGDTVYLSSAGGSDVGTVTNVAPITAGHAVVKIGYMEDASTLIFDPDFQLIN